MPESSLDATSSDLDKLAVIAKKYFGLSLSQSKVTLINTRLRKRLDELELERFSDYFEQLEGKNARSERNILLSLLTTNVTYFFREEHHFETLKTQVLPPLIRKAQQGGRVRIWSAGCASGQEVYSIAMTVLDLCPEAARLDFKILGTDIDPKVIEKAKAGAFHKDELDGVPEKSVKKYLNDFESDEVVTVSDRLRNLTKFGVHNLIDPLPFNGPFDVIFCRNVAIYFARETQMNLWNTLTRVLADGGYLFIGHSEHIRVNGPNLLEKIGVTSYKKQGKT